MEGRRPLSSPGAVNSGGKFERVSPRVNTQADATQQDECRERCDESIELEIQRARHSTPR